MRMTTHQNGTTVYGDWYINSSTVVQKVGSLQGTVTGQTLQATFTPVDGTAGYSGMILMSSSTSATLQSFTGGVGSTSLTSTFTVTQ